MAGLLLFSGCSSLLTGEAPPDYRYQLVPASNPTSPPAETKGFRPSLFVQLGTVGIGLSGDRIVARDPLRVTPIKGLRWVEPTTDLVEKTLTRHLEQSGLFSYVTGQKGGPPTDLVLVVDLRSLYVNLDEQIPASVDVAISLRLIDRLQKQPLGIAILSEHEPLKGTDSGAIIQGFQAAASRLMTRVTRELQQDLASVSPSA
ncbi:MAG: membrane integrity-associated transporter subunit PqiC [Hahellaceae bacterium]|nr:membrane integrity-associated transporter subunit PqiC [Hahellaceae bacterium]